MAEYADDQYAHGQQYTDDQAYPTQEFAPHDKSDAQPQTERAASTVQLIGHRGIAMERAQEMDADSGLR